MSSYINEIKEATTFIHKDNFKTILHKIKIEAAKSKWACYGWRNDILKSKNLRTALSIFGIKLADEDNGYYRPVIQNTYVSDVFEALTAIATPYMTEGEMVVDDGINKIIVSITKDNKITVWWRFL